jgi:microcystin-dependent protein
MDREKYIYIYTTFIVIIGFLITYFVMRPSGNQPQKAAVYSTESTPQSITAVDSLGNISSLSFPTGMIMIWYPSDTSLTSLNLLTIASTKMGVPSGWAICDGTKGTPDLRGRFVLMAQDTIPSTNAPAGSSVHAINQAGGEEKHVLTIDEMPSHSHLNKRLFTCDVSGGGNALCITRNDSLDGYYGPLVAESGKSNSHNIMPPYYTLVYIMKL